MMENGSDNIRTAILKTVAFFDTMDYPPSWTEVCAWGERGLTGHQDTRTPGQDPGVLVSWCPVRQLEEAKYSLISSGLIEEGEGRVALKGRLGLLLTLVRERTPFFPRKIRTARKVTSWLARNPAVRFVALANTTALAHARDGGDLDFFVVVRAGSIWSSRLLGGAPYRLTGRLSGPGEGQDAICLSYFVSDDALDLVPHMLPGDDPYFRYWFLALLPLFDDGVSKDLWAANRVITSHHPCSEPWMTSPDLRVMQPAIRIPGIGLVEGLARMFQRKWFPQNIRERMNKDTSVLVNDHVLKFHVDDGRLAYRTAYQERLRILGL